METEAISPAGATLLFLAFLAATAAIASAMLFVFAQLTGWRRLARQFPLLGPSGPAGSGSVVLGPNAWNGPPLRLGLDACGVALHPVRPFAPAFEPVRIPWADIVSVERREYQFFTVLEVRCGKGAGTTLGFLPSAAATAIAERFGSAAFVAACE